MDGGKVEMDATLQYFGHEHPLVFVQDWQITASQYCRCCGKSTKGDPSYCCSLTACKFFLHKSCAELELPPTICHASHPKHALRLVLVDPASHPKPTPFPLIIDDGPVNRKNCNFCDTVIRGFSYRCSYSSCYFRLDVNCALSQPSLAENFPNSVHDHPLALVRTPYTYSNLGFVNKPRYDCKACKKPINEFLLHYKCFHCDNNIFSLHMECVDIPLQIKHPYDRLHSLSLFPHPISHQEECSCYSCKIIKWDGFVYRCPPCNIELTPEDVSAPQTISDTSHEHPWTLVPCPMSFTCDFCGLEGNRTPYLCTTCNLVVHRKCTSLPRAIRIARHRHPISHVYSLQQSDDDDRLYEECRICYEKVMARYGSYFCSAPNCNYIAHVHCATDRNIWDGTVVLEGDEMSDEFDQNMIRDVISEVKVGEDVMAMEIKHAFHRHTLMLSFKDQIMDDNICNGCMRPISSTHFYNCKKCSFFLHKSCAELPRVIGHPIHKHLLYLIRKLEDLFTCTACDRFHDGFVYTCMDTYCREIRHGVEFKLDIQCSLLPDSLRHPSHEQHRLFLSHDYRGDCRGCPKKGIATAYRCTKRCDFAVDVRCLTLPETVKYKYDKHPLTLAYYDNSDPNQIYCDVCEEKRDSSNWFYYCAHCDNSVHQECALGQLPFIQIGRKSVKLSWHEHGDLTLVDNIWDCPPCGRCRKICYRHAVKCEECNYTEHWDCPSENVLRLGGRYRI